MNLRQLLESVDQKCTTSKLSIPNLKIFLEAAERGRNVPITMSQSKGVSLWNSSSELKGRNRQVPKIMVRISGKTIGFLLVEEGQKLRFCYQKEKTNFVANWICKMDLKPESYEVDYASKILSHKLKAYADNEGIQKEEMQIHAALHAIFAENTNKRGSLAAGIWPTTPFCPAGQKSSWERVVFQLALPISAAKKESKEEIRNNTGYSDLVVRMNSSRGKISIGLLEIKKSKISEEEARVAFFQAIAYAAALRNVLVSEGDVYPRLLGLNPRKHSVSRIWAIPALPERMEAIAKAALSEYLSQAEATDPQKLPIFLGYLLYRWTKDKKVAITKIEKNPVRLA